MVLLILDKFSVAHFRQMLLEQFLVFETSHHGESATIYSTLSVLQNNSQHTFTGKYTYA